MKHRIALSLGFAASLIACGSCVTAGADDEQDQVAVGRLPDAGADDGIGTSPSLQATTLPRYGLWVDVSTDAADLRALAGAEPDLIAFPGDHVSGSDLIAFGNTRWPGQHVVRVVTFRARWQAIQVPP